MDKIKPNDQLSITVKNWNKWQGDKRKKHEDAAPKKFTWWAFSNDYFDDPAIIRLGAIGQQVFNYILTQCSKMNRNCIATTLQLLCKRITTAMEGQRNCSVSAMQVHLKHIQAVGLIEIVVTHNITGINESKDSSIPTKHNIKLHSTFADSRHSDSVESVPPVPAEIASAKKDNTPIMAIVDLWNQTAGLTFPKVTKLPEKRKRQIRLRWKENPDLEYWRKIFETMPKSQFMRENKWATFDWVMKNDANHVKVAEGNYSNPDESSEDDIARRIKLTEEDQARRAAEREAKRGSA